MSLPAFVPIELPAPLRGLRSEVRAFLAGHKPPDSHFMQCDPEFSRLVGERGWIGMTWPRRWGGGERTGLERHVVIEELLAAGAPIAYHWVADRQSGPLILRYGTDAQRARFVPMIAAGRCGFAIGLSEPNAGSDLSGIKTRAVRGDDGRWRVSGTKVWTSNAHRADFMIVLARTSPASDDRRFGFGQFIVDLRASGIAVHPIRNLAGEHEFNEVVLDAVVVDDDMRLGEPDRAWAQLVSELALERSGPDRFVSALPLLRAFIDAVGPTPTDEEADLIGRFSAHLWTLRQMSIAVANVLHERSPDVEAAIVKDLGTSLEQEIVRRCRALRPAVLERGGSAYETACAHAMLYMPRVTVQGGTTQILRNAIARGLDLR